MPHGYRDGHTLVAPVIEMPTYLAYLTDRPAKAGGMEEATTRPPNRTYQQRMVTPNPTSLSGPLGPRHPPYLPSYCAGDGISPSIHPRQSNRVTHRPPS